MVECPDFPLLLVQPINLMAMGMGAPMGGVPPGGPMPNASATLSPSPMDPGMPVSNGASSTPPPLGQ
jgi:hypothetical protein